MAQTIMDNENIENIDTENFDVENFSIEQVLPDYIDLMYREEPKMPNVYKVGDKFWLVEKAEFVEEKDLPADAEICTRFADGKHGIDEFIRLLKFYNYPLGEFTPKEELEEAIRKKRNELLAATDYLILADYPISAENKQTVAEYRQALRDITKLEGFPWDGGGEKTPWPELVDIDQE